VTLPTFIPSSPAVVDSILDEINAGTSLAETARLHNTTQRALSAWLQTPQVIAHQLAIDKSNAGQIRSRCIAGLEGIAGALEAMVINHAAEERYAPIDTTNLAALEQRRRARHTACRAASLFLRIARFDPTAPRPRWERPPRPDGPGRPDPYKPDPTAPPQSDPFEHLLTQVLDLAAATRAPAPITSNPTPAANVSPPVHISDFPLPTSSLRPTAEVVPSSNFRRV